MARLRHLAERRRRYASLALTFLSAALGLVVSTWSVWESWGKFDRSRAVETAVTAEQLKTQLEAVKHEAGKAELALKQIQELSKRPGGADEIAVKELSARLVTFETRVGALESALTTSPDRALALPLLSRDFQAYKEQHQRDVAALTADVGRTYDMMKWVLGMIGAAVLSLALGTLFKREKKE